MIRTVQGGGGGDREGLSSRGQASESYERKRRGLAFSCGRGQWDFGAERIFLSEQGCAIVLAQRPHYGIGKIPESQGRSYHHINGTGSPSYRGLTMCYYSPTNRAFHI
ncbi:hypothetical protein TNCV_2283691 [Trichonephila clavipes]|nr:hypothetical protein TNCV_2283691 [Trichonephila clavipes]